VQAYLLRFVFPHFDINVKDYGYVLDSVDVLDILLLINYLFANYLEHCVMMFKYVVAVYVSSDPGTYMVHIRFAFQKSGVT
jgi:hypothetical protein